ncbi:MAG: hypothetical protein J6A05_05410 [Oscillospiraceae bacterium]|nr:hypothetical protein [Oscillospiraceae bacterium]
MKLYHNADIQDLANILKNGLLPLDVTNNNRWNSGKRAENRTDVVYLFSPTGKQNSFTNYGICLIEVDVDSAVENPLAENDKGNGKYLEYVVSDVKPEQINAVYIPEIFRGKAEKYITDASKIVWCEMYAEQITGTIAHDFFNVELIYSEASNEIMHRFAETANICVDDFNYFRGIDKNNCIIDLYNIKYFTN